MLIYSKILYYLSIKLTKMPVKQQWENVLKIRLKTWQFCCSIFLKLSYIESFVENNHYKCGSRTDALKEEITLFIKRSVQSRLEYFFLPGFFFSHDHDEKINTFSLSKYPQEHSYILQKLGNLEQDLVTLDNWILMNLSIKMLEKTLFGNIQIMA